MSWIRAGPVKYSVAELIVGLTTSVHSDCEHYTKEKNVLSVKYVLPSHAETELD